MIYVIIIGLLMFGILIYLGTKRYRVYNTNYIVNKSYVSVPANMTDIENKLLDLINNHRKSLNINEVINTDSFTRDLAEAHCEYMIEAGKSSHDNFNERSLLVMGIGGEFVSEVVAYGFSTAGGMLTGYLNSPSHKKIIEKDGFTHVGLRIMSDNNGRYYNTIIFFIKNK